MRRLRLRLLCNHASDVSAIPPIYMLSLAAPPEAHNNSSRIKKDICMQALRLRDMPSRPRFATPLTVSTEHILKDLSRAEVKKFLPSFQGKKFFTTLDKALKYVLYLLAQRCGVSFHKATAEALFWFAYTQLLRPAIQKPPFIASQ